MRMICFFDAEIKALEEKIEKLIVQNAKLEMKDDYELSVAAHPVPRKEPLEDAAFPEE